MDEGMRADVFVAGRYPEYPRSALRTLFEHKDVKIGDKIAKPGYKLKAGDRVVVDTRLLSEPEAIELPVIYEDDDVVVINKPAGVLTHSKGVLNLEPTVATFLSSKIKDDQLAGNRAGIVHRLDRATSGLLIGAKNSSALAYLQKQFSTHRVKKKYLAIVEGRPEPATGTTNAPIGRNPKKPQSFKVMPSGRPAQTNYKTLKTFYKNSKEYSLLELEPLTGRTHQLRVHLAYIGHPIVGDPLYGNGGNDLLLHAQELELTLPSGKHQTFSVPPPRVFNDFHKI